MKLLLNLLIQEMQLADSRDADIIQAIGKDPSIKMKELVNILTPEYPKMNSNIISKRIQIHSHLIESKSAPKAGGYHLKKQDQSHSSYSYASYQRCHSKRNSK